MWQGTAGSAPFVSLFADVGRVIAVAADGAVIEGRAQNSDGRTKPVA
jgi:hypothetical protein